MATPAGIADVPISAVPTDLPPETWVVAVDFGTSRTAYAYCQVQDISAFNRVTFKVPADPECPTDHNKTLTAILLEDLPAAPGSPGGACQIRAFGYTAHSMFQQSDAPDTLLFFKYFKMELQKLQAEAGRSSDPTLIDTFRVQATGGTRSLPLMTVISKALEHVRISAMEDVRARDPAVAPTDVVWVLTVPAIWTQLIKHFMRVAAHRAGMTDTVASKKLMLCLEPEGACLTTVFEETRQLGRPRPGFKFIICDAGGGTLDITGHELQSLSPLRLKEVFAPDGGPFGSTEVDKEFKALLRQLLGVASYEQLVAAPLFELETMREFEQYKITFNKSRERAVQIKLANVMMNVLGQAFPLASKVEAFNAGKPSDMRITTLGKTTISIPPALFLSLYEPTLQNAANKLRDVVNEKMPDCGKIFLVGGFGDSTLLLDRLRAALPQHDIITTQGAGVAIVKGAVYYGLTNSLASRKAQETYGLKTSTIYRDSDPEHHRHPELKFKQNGKDYINKFHTFVKKDEDVPVNHVTPKQTFHPLTDTQTQITFEFMTADEHDVFNPNTARVAGTVTLDVDMNRSPPDRAYDVEMAFGGTEIGVTITDHLNGRVLSSDQVRITFRT
jgi:molecular chaperone DnaK (HSP70)